MNAKIRKTKRALLDAFCRLIETVSPEDITVSQLCQEAGINRTTFYRYYAVPMDVVIEAVDQMTAETIYSADHTQRTVYDYMVLLCNTYYENRALMRIYVNASGNMMHLLYKIMMRQAEKVPFMEDPMNLFIAGGVSSTVMAWILRGCTESPEQIAQYLTECIARLDPDK